MKISYRILSLIILLPVLLSCNYLSNILPSSKSAEETPSPSPTLQIINPTSSSQLREPCPIQAGSPEVFAASGYEETQTELLQYLNSGAKMDDLLSSLDEGELLQIGSPRSAEEDFTGDGFLDLAIILWDPEPDFMSIPGQVILYQCIEDRYEIVYLSTESDEWGSATIHSSADLNSDDVSDLLISRQTCGAHTCFAQLEILVWSGETFENRLQGTSEDMPSPTIEVYPETTEITVIAEGIGSIGAGPYRRFLRTWTWDANVGSFLPSSDTFLPSNFRIHALHDADQAVENGDYASAIESYYTVIENDELLDYLDPLIEHTNLGAYASFRLILTYLLMNDFEAAEDAYTSITYNYPPGDLGADFALMADAFWSEYESSGDLGSACFAAQAFANSHQETIIDVLYYGYANPSYEAVDLCPFAE